MQERQERLKKYLVEYRVEKAGIQGPPAPSCPLRRARPGRG